ncbi:hypothetical protein DFP75_1149 [Marinomonas alcarazii]|uniref:Uncharacterized protein n=1 Tax=Marinomonas alcarazii TaxID=491949 RepID=A0A318UNJ3_9GAMM|nr:hypothetical protein [Marinomonas alcarazii]PYF77964.1 hypothetical protein DFP75_1149 [Marinomonas alcarazii]
MDSNIPNINKTPTARSAMRNKIAPWMAALVCAIAIHILILEISENQHWFDIDTQPSNFQLLLLPAQNNENDQPEESDTFAQDQEMALPDMPEEPQPANAEQVEPASIDNSGAPTGKELSERTTAFDPEEIISNMDNPPEDLSGELQEDGLQSTEQDSIFAQQQLNLDKPDLLDLSKVSLSPEASNESLSGVFSAELREKIEESKKAQKEYLKGLTKETDYPVTKDADGTRYVNIKGVCWRLPKEGSNESWAIVFDGCGVKSKLFHFELNISPSVFTNELLGPDSPFNLNQPVQ